MTKRFFKILLYYLGSLLLYNTSRAQNVEEEDGFFADSVSFAKPDVKFITDLNSLRPKFIDTLEKPFGYIIETNPEPFLHRISFAVKDRNGFKVFTLIDDVDDIVKIIRTDFDKTNNKELLIEYSNTCGVSGSSGGAHGWNEHEKWLSIWDLDEPVNLGKFPIYFSHTSWWETFDPNESDTLPDEKRTVIDYGGEQFCINYAFKTGKKIITFTEVTICNDNEEGIIYPIKKARIVKYKLGKTALVKLKTRQNKD